ncbi:hypothetical protein BDV97DRAFT_354908 [Delphinella strobiligena]|nr:hypothetical protein BDV97DRAFT_354908 [Delphinella strobiligena]
MIIKYTDHDTMCSLRLSNKWVSEVSKRPFAEAYMAERRHVMSRQSLVVLAEITAHKDFGPAVRTILLGSSRLTSTGVEELESRIHELDMHIDNNANWDFCDELVQEQDSLDTTAEGVDLVKEALHHISARGQTVVLGTWVSIIHQTERSLFPASSAAPWFRLRRSKYLYSGFGCEKLYGGLFPDDFDDELDVDHEFTNSSKETLDIILAAMEGDKCPVDGLQLELSGTEDEIEEFSSRFSQALASWVRTLSIRVGLKNKSGSGCVGNVRSLLQYTSNVESISITVNPHKQNASRSFAKASIGQMLRSVATKKLRALHLTSITKPIW